MKATIDKEGFLIVSPETDVEKFALQCWLERMDAPFGQRRAGWKFALDDGVYSLPVIPLPSQESRG